MVYLALGLLFVVGLLFELRVFGFCGISIIPQTVFLMFCVDCFDGVLR